MSDNDTLTKGRASDIMAQINNHTRQLTVEECKKILKRPDLSDKEVIKIRNLLYAMNEMLFIELKKNPDTLKRFKKLFSKLSK